MITQQAVTKPVQLQSPWLRVMDHSHFFPSECLGPSSLPGHCPGIYGRELCGQKVEASLG